jgi:hypothetical protein
MKTKKCPKCGEELPLTNKYFGIDNRSSTGFKSWCKSCVNKAAREKRERPKKYEKAESDLPKQGIPNLNMKVGKKYSFIVDKQGKGTERRKFTGEVIQICNTHIVFKTKNYVESFLKVDLNNYKISEV